jgi:hypothetical protein
MTKQPAYRQAGPVEIVSRLPSLYSHFRGNDGVIVDPAGSLRQAQGDIFF